MTIQYNSIPEKSPILNENITQKAPHPKKLLTVALTHKH